MSAPVPEQRRRSLPSRLRRSLCALAGSVGITIGTGAAALPTAASAEGRDYQASGNAPVAWLAFAERARSQFRERLSMNDAAALRFNRWLEDRAAIDANPSIVMAKVWVTPVGTVERLEFDQLDGEAADNLRNVLVGIDLRAMPPRDMLQPMHLKLSLGPEN